MRRLMVRVLGRNQSPVVAPSDRRGLAQDFLFRVRPIFERIAVPIASFDIELIGPLGDESLQISVVRRGLAFDGCLGGGQALTSRRWWGFLS